MSWWNRAITVLGKPGRSSISYERVWEDAELGTDDYVISADEKTSIQARRRKQPKLPSSPNRPTRVEHEYFREGAWTYLAAEMPIGPRSSAAANSRAASPLWIGLSPKS